MVKTIESNKVHQLLNLPILLISKNSNFYMEVTNPDGFYVCFEKNG